MTKIKQPKLGFIGQGWIGRHYADAFEARGFSVVRYAKEPHHEHTKAEISTCDIVFIAVPTPTTTKGYSAKIILEVLPLVGKGKIAVLKSTILPGMTKKIQDTFPNRIIMHSPEFLSEATAKYDASHPFANIVGITKNTTTHKKAAQLVHSVLPPAPFTTTVSSTEAEIIKYAHNCSGFTQIIFFNAVYDIANSLGATWDAIQPALLADPFIPNRYSSPIHKTGRGAGGHCFIKDFAALREIYARVVKDKKGVGVLRAMEDKNIDLLLKSKKDLDLLTGVYGKKVSRNKNK